MALNINTNIGALGAAAAATSVNKSMETAMERLSTGKRINTAADDAAGVAIASRLTADIRGTNQAIRNAMDGQAMIDTAEGAHNEIQNILQRMRELAVQGANDTNGASDRSSLQAEMTQLTSEINRIAATTTWAGVYLLNGNGADGAISTTADATNTFNYQISSKTDGTLDHLAVSMQAVDATSLGVGGSTSDATVAVTTLTQGGTNFNAVASAGQLVFTAQAASAAPTASGQNAVIFTVDGTSYTFDAYTNGTQKGFGGTGTTTATTIGEAFEQFLEDNLDMNNYVVNNTAGTVTIDRRNSVSVSSNSNAQASIVSIDAAIEELNTQRANLGAFSNRLDNTVANLTNIATNLEAGRSRIQDADFAAESTNLARSQILQQASMAMLAQANASKQGVLQLLQG
jgi:flagellin